MKFNLKNTVVGVIVLLLFITIDASFAIGCIVMFIYGFAFPIFEKK